MSTLGRVGIAIVACVLAALAAHAADDAEKAAAEAATRWLGLVDAGDYRASWEQSSSVFRQLVSSEQWERQVAQVRAPLGKLVSRSLVSAEPLAAPAGAQKSTYIVLRFHADYEHRKGTTETVTSGLDEGTWRVAGYFVR
jgi:hypothetical protein